MAYRKQAHATYLCDYHLICATKYRHKVINDGIFRFMAAKLTEIKKHYPEIEFKEINHDVDHIHLLVSIPPKYAVSSIVRIIKSNTARAMKQKFPHLRQVYWGAGFWSDGYFVSTVGLHESTIRAYIKRQGEEDSGRTSVSFQ